MAAADALAAALPASFPRFANGGVPLFERRAGTWRQEIVLRAGRGRPTPIRASVYLSHPALKDLRSLYWRPASRAPTTLAFGDLGHLDLPPAWFVYEDAPEALAEDAARLALPWFALFDRPSDVRAALFGRGIALVDHQAAVECLLVLGREDDAREYLSEFVASDERFWTALRRLDEMPRADFDRAPAEDRLAALARSCRLV
jgi:hypothetical protein